MTDARDATPTPLARHGAVSAKHMKRRPVYGQYSSARSEGNAMQTNTLISYDIDGKFPMASLLLMPGGSLRKLLTSTSFRSAFRIWSSGRRGVQDATDGKVCVAARPDDLGSSSYPGFQGEGVDEGRSAAAAVQSRQSGQSSQPIELLAGREPPRSVPSRS